MNVKAFFELLKESYAEWSEDKASRLAAAFSYYTIFSIAPLLVVIIAIAGLVFGEDAARDQISGQISGLVGETGGKAIQEMIKNANKPAAGIMATIIGLATLLLGASGVFGQLQDALNTIWEVQPKPGQGFWATIKSRFLSFSLVLGTGFLLLVSLVLSAALSALGAYMQNVLPIPEWIIHILNFVISFAIVTLLFAMIYKVLPDVEIEWRDVWVGAAMTALLFAIGKFALGMYLGRGSVGSAYGAAGSLVVILLWVNYAAQILFFGAEFTQVYCNKYGSRMKPAPNAEPVTAEARAQQGMGGGASDAETVPGGRSVEVWAPHGAANGPVPAARAGSSGPIDKRDVDYLMAAAIGFAATIFLFRRGRR